jgi:hypothetical protein
MKPPVCRLHGPLQPEQYQTYDRTGKRGGSRWACKACNRAKSVAWYYRHQDKARAAALNRHRVLRREVLAAYGDACACCGETTPEFLSVDHVNSDGAAHRREIGASKNDTAAVLRWLKKHNFPREGFRLLCFNCHLARTFWGSCPHEATREKTG